MRPVSCQPLNYTGDNASEGDESAGCPKCSAQIQYTEARGPADVRAQPCGCRISQLDTRSDDGLRADGAGGEETHHVVCHDCTFEEVIDETNAPTGNPERDAGYAWHNHRQETRHDVERARIAAAHGGDV